MGVDYFLKNHDEEVWRTISVVTIDGEPHAYQQRLRVARPKWKNDENGFSNSDTFGSEMVETDEHRFIPVADTVPEEHVEKLIEGLK